ncbi:MAG: cysteine desulfurase [Deltaproteobacteria bacterium]|nr:cysteine desulfurase [Deltaproteobacteria bacterium]
MKAAYLDHNATSPPSEAVARRVAELLEAGLGNPSAAHGPGARGRAVVEAARRAVARLLGAHPSEVVFTSGGSEACATAVRHLWASARARGRARPVLVAAATEHQAVLEALGALERSGEAELRLLPVGAGGEVSGATLEEALAGADGLCLMAANNETGVLADLDAVGRAAAEAQVPWFCDAVQAVGRVPLSFGTGPGARMSMLALAGHKLGAPAGVGALLVRRGLELTPLIRGGPQEGGRRAGTEAAALLGGLEVAVGETTAYLERGGPTRTLALRRRLEDALLGAFRGSRVHGAQSRRLPGTTSVCLALPSGEAADGEELLLALAERGVAVGTGAACASGSGDPSHVLLAMGATPAEAQASLRFSLGRGSTEAEVDRAVAALREVAGL